jgi:hypothetical protein
MENLEPQTKRNILGMSKRKYSDVEIEEGLETLSTYLDGLFRVPGTGWKFGLDSLIGLIPNVGDTLTSLASFYILFAGVRYGVPKITLLRMAFNIGLDYLVGTIPFIGDAFDFFWKANKQNMDLIRERATGKNVGTTGDYIFVIAVILVLIGLLIGSIVVSVLILAALFKTFWGYFNF